MNPIKHPLAAIVIIAGLSVLHPALARDTVSGTPITVGNGNDTAATDGAPDTSSTRLSEQGHFRVSYRSRTEPIPLNRIHSWTLHLESATGDAVDDAQIAIYGGMPAHKHGFPTAPRVTQALGNGDYLVEGLKFSMSGHWELWLNIRAGGQTDKAVLNIMLP